MVLLCTGCGLQFDMPLGGAVEFHDIAVTLPDGYVRDSTESTGDLWIFETGFYRKYVMLVRKDLTGDAAALMNSYAAYLTEQGALSVKTIFNGHEALRSSMNQGGVLWQEVYFAHGDSTYAIALRGGSEADFEAIINTVRLLEPADE